jgi:hypothetical protein
MDTPYPLIRAWFSPVSFARSEQRNRKDPNGSQENGDGIDEADEPAAQFGRAPRSADRRDLEQAGRAKARSRRTGRRAGRKHRRTCATQVVNGEAQQRSLIGGTRQSGTGGPSPS